ILSVTLPQLRLCLSWLLPRRKRSPLNSPMTLSSEAIPCCCSTVSCKASRILSMPPLLAGSSRLARPLSCSLATASSGVNKYTWKPQRPRYVSRKPQWLIFVLTQPLVNHSNAPALSRLRPSAVGSLTESRVIPPRSLACHFQSCAERCILSAYLSVNYGRLSTLRWMRNLLRQLLRQQVQSTSPLSRISFSR